jgi:hypothetical protein
MPGKEEPELPPTDPTAMHWLALVHVMPLKMAPTPGVDSGEPADPSVIGTIKGESVPGLPGPTAMHVVVVGSHATPSSVSPDKVEST